MAKQTKGPLRMDLTPIVKTMGMAWVVEQLGAKQVIEQLGLSQVVKLMGGAKQFLAGLDPEVQQEFKRFFEK